MVSPAASSTASPGPAPRCSGNQAGRLGPHPAWFQSAHLSALKPGRAWWARRVPGARRRDRMDQERAWHRALGSGQSRAGPKAKLPGLARSRCDLSRRSSTWPRRPTASAEGSPGLGSDPVPTASQPRDVGSRTQCSVSVSLSERFLQCDAMCQVAEPRVCGTIQVKGRAPPWHALGFGKAVRRRTRPSLALRPFSEDPCSASPPSPLSKPLLLSEPQFPYVHHGPSAPSLCPAVLQRSQGPSGHPGPSPGLASLRYLSAGSSVILECCQFGKSEINVLPSWGMGGMAVLDLRFKGFSLR